MFDAVEHANHVIHPAELVGAAVILKTRYQCSVLLCPPLSWCSNAKAEIFLQLLNGEGEALQWNFIEPAHPCCVGEGRGNLFPPSRPSDATI